MRTPSVLRPTMLLLLGVLGVVMLGACGQKGPLYLPDPAAKPVAAPAPADDKDAKKKDETPPVGARTPR